MSLETLGPHEGDAEALARRLARALLGGRWQPGDAFPKELDIAAHCAVSRNLVRNALASLTAAGLLERTAGRGTRVREVGDWHLLDPQMSDWLVGLEAPQPQLVRAGLPPRGRWWRSSPPVPPLPTTWRASRRPSVAWPRQRTRRDRPTSTWSMTWPSTRPSTRPATT